MFRVGLPAVGRLGAALITAAIVAAPAATAATAAAANQRGCQVVHNLLVCVAVNAQHPPASGPAVAPGPKTCSFQGQVHPCFDNLFGWFDSTDGCYYNLLSPQPAYDPQLWEGHPLGQGAIYQFTCTLTNGTGGGWKWRATSAQPVTVTPGQLALQALATLSLPKPVPPQSPSGATLPDGRPFTVVRVPTWFWTTPASYQPKSARASAGPVFAEVTVTPAALTFAPGDGDATVSCAGPGTAWTPAAGQWARAPAGCDYAYPQSTYGYPRGQLAATYGIVWRATWVGSGGAGGTFPDITTTATSRFAVAEAQAVIVK